MSVNKVILLGRVGKDPEIKSLNDGTSVLSMSLATSEKYKDKSGELVESTEWHRIKAFGKTADNMGSFLKKGSLVYVEGKLKTNKWTDANGIEKYSTEINVNLFQALDKREGSSSSEPASSSQDYAKASQGGGLGSIDDDIPF